jgi:TonB family protein
MRLVGLAAMLACGAAAQAQQPDGPPVEIVMACASGTHAEVALAGNYVCRSVDNAGLPVVIAPPVHRSIPRTDPVLLYAVDPVYPLSAAYKDEEGACLVAMVVDPTGLPENVHILKSVSPELDTAAVNAVRQYKFRPATEDGEPIPAKVAVEVKFHVSSL